MQPDPSNSSRLAEQLREQIRAGAYAPGDKLPSIRKLAERHGYSKNSVVQAFERLVATGDVEPRPGSGYYVSRSRSSSVAEEEVSSVDRALDSIWMLREQLNNDPLHLPIGHGIPPTEWLVGNRLDRVQQRVARIASHSIFQYGNRYGYRPLRDQLERKLAGMNIEARASQIVLTFGANEALDIVVRGLMRPGDIALVDEPGYYPLYGKLRLHGATVVGVPREPDGPNIAAFERLIEATKAKVFFTQSVGQNPTGSDTSPAKAFRLLQIAEKSGLTIVENDALADLKPTASTRMCTLDQLRRTVYVGSFTKSVAAGLRVGFIAAEAALAERLADVKMVVHVSTSEFAERTVDAVLRAPEYPRLLAELQLQVERSTRHASKVLNGLGARIFSTPSHSLYHWCELPWAPDSLVFARTLLNEQIAMAPGAFFTVDAKNPSGWSRFNVGYVADPRFTRAMLKYRPRRAAT